MAAPLKVGIAGAGMMGAMHSACYATLKNVEVVAVASERRNRVEQVAAEHDAQMLRTWEELLEEVDVDIIDVCLPTFMHAQVAIAAMKRGRHVICEKPMAMKVADADRMIKTAEDNQVKLMIGHVLRFWPEYQALDQLRTRKKLGALKSFIARRSGGTPVWSWKNWAQDPERSGGTALDLHIHDIDFALHLFGPPKSVTAVGRGEKPGSEQISTTFHYDDDVMAVAEGSWHPAPSCPFEMAFSAGFEKGVVFYSNAAEPTLYACPARGERYTPSLPKSKQQMAATGGNIDAMAPYANELEYFLSCVRGNKEPAKCTPQESRMSLKVVLAAMKSVETGKTVKI